MAQFYMLKEPKGIVEAILKLSDGKSDTEYHVEFRFEEPYKRLPE